MGNYLENKNFIPRKYIKSQNLKKNKGSKRGIVTLVIINLLILPFSLDALTEKKEVLVNDSPKVVESGFSIECIQKWIDQVDEEVLSMCIRNNSGTIAVNSMQKVYKLEESSGAIINSIESSDAKIYNLQITRNN